MKDLIFAFVNQYAVWGILLAVLLAAFLQWRMHRQIKRLNRNFGVIAGKMQEYFNVIMEEEEPKEMYRPTEDTHRRDWEITKEEREFLLSGKKKPDPEDEAVFNAVMQEYFS